MWTPARTAAGFPKLRFHHLRHSAVPVWIAMGANLLQVSRWLGHSSVQITADVYGHLFPETNDLVIQRLDEALRGSRPEQIGSTVPRLSSFYGLVIYIYSRDHAPPHFHAEYGEAEALLVISDGSVYAGSLPPRALRMVRAWRRLHVEDLEEAWELASSHRDPGTIDPLP